MKKHRFNFINELYISCIVKCKQLTHYCKNKLHPNPLKLHKLKIHFSNSNKIIDIRDKFFRNENWFHLFDPQVSFICMTWSFNNIKHKRLFTDPKSVTFPFYDIKTLYSEHNGPCVIAFSINNDQSYTQMIKKYAGPFHNYYNQPIDLSLILGFRPSSVFVIYSNGSIITYDSHIFQLKA